MMGNDLRENYSITRTWMICEVCVVDDVAFDAGFAM